MAWPAAVATGPRPAAAPKGLLLLAIVAGAAKANTNDDDFSPIIGMFSLPADQGPPGMPNPCGEENRERDGDATAPTCEMLPASYVKFIEAAGGQVVPVSFSAGYEEVEMLTRSLNGFLFTDGPDMPVPPAFQWVLERSRALHKAGVPGDSLPIWGTCLGFELLVDYVAKGALQSGIQALNISVPLQFTEAAGASRMFSEVPRYVLDGLAKHNTTFNMHHRGVTPQHWAEFPTLGQTFDVLSTSVDEAGVPFISTIEGKDGLPWFGVQWHPEKNAFEQGLKADGTPFERISHGPRGVAAAQYVASFFVGEARRSAHRFASAAEEEARLIYGHATSGVFSPAFVEVYILRYSGDAGPPVRPAPWGQPCSVQQGEDDHVGRPPRQGLSTVGQKDLAKVDDLMLV